MSAWEDKTGSSATEIERAPIEADIACVGFGPALG